MAGGDLYVRKLLYNEWNAVTKPILKKLNEMNADILLTCVDGRGTEEDNKYEAKLNKQL